MARKGRPYGRSLAALLSFVLLGLTPATARAMGVIVGSIPVAGGAPNGGVIALADGTVFVGEGGTFGTGGGARVLRIAPGGATSEIAHGLNAVSGFAYDAANDTLYVGDNGGDFSGAVTGDTVFAIPSAFTRGTSAAAAGLEIVAAGTIPSASDVLLTPSGDVLVSDAAGAGAGRVVKITAGSATNLITGLDFAGGLSLSGSTLLVGDTSSSSFLGSVGRYGLDGSFLGSLASGLPGAFDMDLTLTGDLLVTGGNFSNSPITSITPGGAVSTLIDGFAFTTAIDVRDSDGLVFVIDSGASAITLVAVPEPPTALALYGALLATGFARRRGAPHPRTPEHAAREGAPACAA